MEIKETEEITKYLLEIDSLLLKENYKEAKALINNLPTTKNKKTHYMLTLAKGLIELKENNYYEALRYFDTAINSPILESEADKVSFIDALLHRSTVNERLNHNAQQNADIKNAMEYAYKNKLLKITSVRDRFIGIVKAEPLYPLFEETIDYLKDKLAPYSVIDVALAMKGRSIW